MWDALGLFDWDLCGPRSGRCLLDLRSLLARSFQSFRDFNRHTIQICKLFTGTCSILRTEKSKNYTDLVDIRTVVVIVVVDDDCHHHQRGQR